MTKISLPFVKRYIWLYLGIFLISCTHSPIRNPVVFIPGTMGSQLSKDGKLLWGKLTPFEAIESDLPLNIQVPDKEEGYSDDGINPKVIKEKIAEIKLTPFLKIGLSTEKVYQPILDHLNTLGDNIKKKKQTGCDSSLDISIPVTLTAPSFLCDLGICPDTATITRSSVLLFPYDWRKSNAETASKFYQYLKKKRIEIRDSTFKEIVDLRSSEDSEKLKLANELEQWVETFKFDVIAHSMGGLIARYFLRYGDQQLSDDNSQPVLDWRGEKDISNLILIGTPNLGSPRAFRMLMTGFNDISFRNYSKAIIGTFPSVYELMPPREMLVFKTPEGTKFKLDHFDSENWSKYGWGLLDDSEENLNIIKKLVKQSPKPKHGNESEEAKKYLKWCLKRAQQFQEALARPYLKEPKTNLYLYTGTGERTLNEVVLEGNTFTWDAEHQFSLKGDGIVPLWSNPPGAYSWKESKIVECEHTKLILHQAVLDAITRILVPQ